MTQIEKPRAYCVEYVSPSKVTAWEHKHGRVEDAAILTENCLAALDFDTFDEAVEVAVALAQQHDALVNVYERTDVECLAAGVWSDGVLELVREVSPNIEFGLICIDV